MQRSRNIVSVAAVLGALWLAPGDGAACAKPLETAAMTSAEIAAAVAAGTTTVLIPSGGTEQNGPHMVTGKHNLIVAETARRIADRLGDALVAPVIAYTPEGDIATRGGHMAYPGSISITPQTFAAILDAAARSFEAHGFKTIVFIGDSGPNQAPQRAVAAALQREWAAKGVRVIAADAYYEAAGAVELLKAEGETDQTIGNHAGIRDTSELMAIAPSAVRLERAVADRDGVSGDPRRASAMRGEALLAIKVKAAVAAIEAARAAPVVAPAPGDVGAPGVLTWIWRMISG